MAQIVREYLARFNSGALTQCFHVPPDITPVKWPSAAGYKYRSGGLFLFLHIDSNQTAQLFRQENSAPFAFAVHLGISLFHRLCGDKAQFGYPDSGGADGLEHQG